MVPPLDSLQCLTSQLHYLFWQKYRVTTINVSRKWIEWAEWAASLCTANSPFPGHVYCRHPVQLHDLTYRGQQFPIIILMLHLMFYPCAIYRSCQMGAQKRTSDWSLSLQCHTRTVHSIPKPGVAHYFRPTLTHTEGSAISCVYRHGSGPTLGGYDSPVSRLTVRHELTCRFATGHSRRCNSKPLHFCCDMGDVTPTRNRTLDLSHERPSP